MSFECVQICKSFDGSVALASVSLAFPSRGAVGIIGPNGAGKTTLLNVMTGFLRPDSGRVRFAGVDVTRLAPHKIAAFGIRRTFQDVRLIREMSVKENMLLSESGSGRSGGPAGVPCWESGEWAGGGLSVHERILDLVGLDGLGRARARDLSYGQQKLLTFASCLAGNAGVLLLDEPVAGVDPEMRERIVRLLLRLRELGKTLVFIEHDIETVRRVADSVVVMDEGRVIASGAPGEVLDRPDIVETYLA